MVVGIGVGIGCGVGVHTSLHCQPVGPPVHCIGILALSCCWVHIRTCCHTCGTSAVTPHMDKQSQLIPTSLSWIN